VKTHGPGERVREEPGDLAQEGAFGLHPSKLPKEGEGYDLRIGELFEGLVAPPIGVEPVVSVVSIWQNKTVTASSRRASGGVSPGRAI
jgi:hypothetical protein